jgi:serine/threonine-protein phosphatase 4 regulatory subunit 1
MATDRDFRVKKSLSSSLAEIANILGPEVTERDLIPYLDKLYKEEGEIQNTILKILPDFLKHIHKNMRRNYLDKLKRLLNPREKWRNRKEYAVIIGNFHNVFDVEITYKQILPIALNFCLDDVAEVRFTAAKHISRIILQILLSGDNEYKVKCMKIIEAFANSVNYNYRQL